MRIFSSMKYITVSTVMETSNLTPPSSVLPRAVTVLRPMAPVLLLLLLLPSTMLAVTAPAGVTANLLGRREIYGGTSLSRSTRELPPSSSEFSAPSFFLRQLAMLDRQGRGVELKEAIRHQRQIKFKSSYRELPEVLRRAEERNQAAGKSLSAPVEVFTEDTASHESTALKDLPPSSEVYFSPEVDKSPGKAAVRKSFGKSLSMEQRNPFRFRTSSSPESSKSLHLKKRGRLIKKKMIGRKLISADTPRPRKIDQDTIKFEVSSTDKIENKIEDNIRTTRRDSFKSSKRTTGGKSSDGHNGGPNPDESFKNPFYIETPAHEMSSYSSVPESSRVSSAAKSFDQQHQVSGTQTQNKPSHARFSADTVSHTVSAVKAQRKIKKRPRSGKRIRNLTPRAMKRERLPSRTEIKPLAPKETSIATEQEPVVHNNWNHFLSKSNHQKSSTSDPHVASDSRRGKGISKQNSFNHDRGLPSKPTPLPSLRKAKSFASNSVPTAVKKMVQKQTGYPDLISIPNTNFKCGSYRGGEYFADVDTKCQVFHVCFGGRQASFVCPVGTSFSQQLLVCDWWHKVQCGGSSGSRQQRSATAQSFLDSSTLETNEKDTLKLAAGSLEKERSTKYDIDRGDQGVPNST